MFCHKCGEPLQEDSVFCSKCGTQIFSNSENKVVQTSVIDSKSEACSSTSEKKKIIQGVHDRGLFTSLLISFIVVFVAIVTLNVITVVFRNFNYYSESFRYLYSLRSCLITIVLCLPMVSILCVERKKYNVVMLILSAVFILNYFRYLIFSNSYAVSHLGEFFEDLFDLDFYYLTRDLKDFLGSLQIGFNFLFCLSMFMAVLQVFILKSCIKIRNIGIRIGSFVISVLVYRLLTLGCFVIRNRFTSMNFRNFIPYWPVYLVALGALVGFLFLNNKTETIEK